MYSPARPLVLQPQTGVAPAGAAPMDGLRYPPPNAAAAAAAARHYDLAQHVLSQHTAAMAKLLGECRPCEPPVSHHDCFTFIPIQRIALKIMHVPKFQHKITHYSLEFSD